MLVLSLVRPGRRGCNLDFRAVPHPWGTPLFYLWACRTSTVKLHLYARKSRQDAPRHGPRRPSLREHLPNTGTRLAASLEGPARGSGGKAPGPGPSTARERRRASLEPPAPPGPPWARARGQARRSATAAPIIICVRSPHAPRRGRRAAAGCDRRAAARGGLEAARRPVSSLREAQARRRGPRVPRDLAAVPSSPSRSADHPQVMQQRRKYSCRARRRPAPSAAAPR